MLTDVPTGFNHLIVYVSPAVIVSPPRGAVIALGLVGAWQPPNGRKERVATKAAMSVRKRRFRLKDFIAILKHK